MQEYKQGFAFKVRHQIPSLSPIELLIYGWTTLICIDVKRLHSGAARLSDNQTLRSFFSRNWRIIYLRQRYNMDNNQKMKIIRKSMNQKKIQLLIKSKSNFNYIKLNELPKTIDKESNTSCMISNITYRCRSISS